MAAAYVYFEAALRLSQLEVQDWLHVQPKVLFGFFFRSTNPHIIVEGSSAFQLLQPAAGLAISKIRASLNQDTPADLTDLGPRLGLGCIFPSNTLVMPRGRIPFKGS